MSTKPVQRRNAAEAAVAAALAVAEAADAEIGMDEEADAGNAGKGSFSASDTTHTALRCTFSPLAEVCAPYSQYPVTGSSPESVATQLRRQPSDSGNLSR